MQSPCLARPLAWIHTSSRAYNRRVPSATSSFRTALDLFEVGVAIARQNLRRASPLADDLEIERRLHRWIQERPGAVFGDCQGRRVETKVGPSDIARNGTP